MSKIVWEWKNRLRMDRKINYCSILLRIFRLNSRSKESSNRVWCIRLRHHQDPGSNARQEQYSWGSASIAVRTKAIDCRPNFWNPRQCRSSSNSLFFLSHPGNWRRGPYRIDIHRLRLNRWEFVERRCQQTRKALYFYYGWVGTRAPIGSSCLPT